MLGAGVVPFAEEVRFLVAFPKVKVLEAGVFPYHLNDLIHPVLLHHIGHDVAQIDVDLPFRHIAQFRMAASEEFAGGCQNALILQFLDPVVRAVGEPPRRVVAGVNLHILAKAHIWPSHKGSGIDDEQPEQIALHKKYLRTVRDARYAIR